LKIKGYDFTLGADPEVFVVEKKTGKFICPHNLIPGTKVNPVPLGTSGNRVQLDGFAAEFNIPPCETQKEFSSQIKQALTDLKKLVGKNYDIVATPVAHFDKKVFDTAPKECLILGCDPDYNAYTAKKDRQGKILQPVIPEENPRPVAEGLNFRTGGGHVHVGWADELVADVMHPEHLMACVMLTRAMDVCLGVPAILRDEAVKRRLLYGKAGAFRPKPYGMEYRSMSNWWVANPDGPEWIWRGTITAIQELWDNKYELMEQFKVARKLIDTNENLNKVINVIEKYKPITHVLETVDV
jgi:hypothetical protein